MSNYCVKISAKSDHHALQNLSSNPTATISRIDNSYVYIRHGQNLLFEQHLLPVCRAMYLRYRAENFRGCVGLVNLDCRGVHMQFLFQGRSRGTFLCLTLLPVYSFQFLSYLSEILAVDSY